MQRLVVIDTETGGLDPGKYSILSLGAAIWDNGHLIDEFEVLIAEPEIIVDPEAMRVNRIDLESHTLNSLCPEDAVDRFLAFLARNFGQRSREERIDLAGHNAHFDVEFAKRLFRQADAQLEDTFSHRILDTAAALRLFILADKLPVRNAGLNEALDFFGIRVPEKKRHTALGDAIATAHLLTKLVELAKTCNVEGITIGG
jgi:DNA polymerase III epsilon subunit-like protein